MNRVVVPKSQIDEILRNLMSDYKLVAPVRQDGSLVFDEVNNTDDVVLTDEVTYKSPKEFLFPQVEKIMVFSKDGQVRINEQVERTVIFGVRPCDLEAIKVLDTVFTQGKYEDTYFKNKLKNTIFIGLGCVSEKPGCFCGERGINKSYSKECDIMLVDDGNSYIAEVISDKGEDLLKGLNLEKTESVPNNSIIRENGETLELNADEKALFEEVDWERISEKCLSCGMCTYICPTCHCFGFRDVVEDGESSRYRCWDSCMYPKFTLHASGHNPRPSKKERYRQRVMHKYLYVKQNFGYTACTGCGRCIRSCPAGMNIKSVVEGIVEDLKPQFKKRNT